MTHPYPDNTFKTWEGLTVPADDVNGARWIRDGLNFLPGMLLHVPGRRLVIQAGGAIGIWPNAYAKHFAQVYTFEPNPKNFYCLVRNLQHLNIHPIHAGLGDAPRFVSTEMVDEGNTGTYAISGEGTSPVLRIDDFAWPYVDLIQLDIEGFEHAAILGAQRTIAQHRPTVILELKNHGERYGVKDAETFALMESLGYRNAGRHFDDVVFVPRER